MQCEFCNDTGYIEIESEPDEDCEAFREANKEDLLLLFTK